MQSCDQSCDFVWRINLCLKNTNMILLWWLKKKEEYKKLVVWNWPMLTVWELDSLLPHLLGTEQLFPLAAKLETAVKSKSPPNKRNPQSGKNTKSRCETSEKWHIVLKIKFQDNHSQELVVLDRTRIILKCWIRWLISYLFDMVGI